MPSTGAWSPTRPSSPQRWPPATAGLRHATLLDPTSREPALAARFRQAERRTTRALAQLVPGDVEQPGQAEVPLLQLGPALLLGRGRRIRWRRARGGAVQLGEAVQPAVVVVPVPFGVDDQLHPVLQGHPLPVAQAA